MMIMALLAGLLVLVTITLVGVVIEKIDPEESYDGEPAGGFCHR